LAKAGIQGLLGYYFKFAGGSPAAGDFLLCGQKKVTKEKAAPVCRSFGLPCAARRTGRLRNSRTGSTIAASRGRVCTSFLGNFARSRSARRILPVQLRCSAAHRGVKFNTVGVRGVFLTNRGIPPNSPCEPPSSTAKSGAVGEDCLSPRAVCEGEFRSRPAWRAAQGTPKGR
jgi:hypothetical protein